MDELEFVKAQPARLPTRRDQAFVPLIIDCCPGSRLAALGLSIYLRVKFPGLMIIVAVLSE
jgi:hypothetical protein